MKRCVAALLELKEEVVYWPDAMERIEMRNRLSAYGFRHCVGIIDGTLIILDFRPEAYHECYYSRKSFYALNVLIVCDDRKRIIYYHAGWPGSTHDNRVFRNCRLFNNRGEYFSQNEYLLGDSAYSSSPIMVQAFKKQAGHGHLQQNNEFFNTCLAQVQISSEHCIGILKHSKKAYVGLVHNFKKRSRLRRFYFLRVDTKTSSFENFIITFSRRWRAKENKTDNELHFTGRCTKPSNILQREAS